jgi:hypothetical protein
MRVYGCLFAISWGLNFGWEMAHSFLYRDVPPFLAHLPFLFLAAVGDGAINLALVGGVSLCLANHFWFLERPLKGLLVLAAFSVVASVLIESLNVVVLKRWEYTATMPRLPLLGIGLTPFLQVALLPAVSVVFASRRCGGLSSAA